jgi:hypothetical protein
MRVLILSVLYCFAISAQQRLSLQEYLKATPEQWEQLLVNFLDYQTSLHSSTQRLETLSRELSAETLKPTISPTELGQRYRQIEDLCRGLTPALVQLHRQQMQVLSPEQRALLPALNNATETILIEIAASSLFLRARPAQEQEQIVPPDGTRFEAPSFYFDPEFGTQKVPQNLVRYLGLTENQQEQIRQYHLSYREFVEQNYARMEELALRIEQQLALESPSADFLGARYAEIEMARRQIASRENLLRRELNALLTQPQRDALAMLDRAETNWLLEIDADRLLLFAPNESALPASTAEFRFTVFASPFSRTDGASTGNSAADTIFRYCKSVPLQVWSNTFRSQPTSSKSGWHQSPSEHTHPAAPLRSRLKLKNAPSKFR